MANDIVLRTRLVVFHQHHSAESTRHMLREHAGTSLLSAYSTASSLQIVILKGITRKNKSDGVSMSV